MHFNKLTYVHLDQVVELCSSRENYSSIVDAETLAFTKNQIRLNTSNILNDVVVENGTYTVFGAFEENNLIAAVFTVCSSQQVSYYLTRAHTKFGILNSQEALSKLFAYIVGTYEEAGYKRFSTLYNARNVDSVSRLWKFNKVLPDYFSYTELELDANKKPKQTEIWEILYGRMLIPEPTVVRTFVKNNV